MPWKIGTSFTAYTIASATSQLTGYEATWLPLIDEHPLIRSWRSANLLDQVITLSFGSLVNLSGILIQNLNVDFIRLARSTNGGSTYVDLNTGSASISDILVGQHWGYRRYCKPLATTATHVQIGVPAQGATDGKPWYEIGSIVFPVFTTWPRAPRPGLRERVTREYERAGNNVAKAGPRRLEQDFTMVLQAGLEPTLKAFALTGEDEPFAVFENNGNAAEGRLMRYEGAIEFERYKKYHNVNSLRFRELV